MHDMRCDGAMRDGRCYGAFSASPHRVAKLNNNDALLGHHKHYCVECLSNKKYIFLIFAVDKIVFVLK